MFLDEADSVGRYAVSYVLVLPECFAATFHETDTTDAVHDALVVSVTGLEVVEQFGILLACRLTFEVLLIADQNGSRGIVVGHMPLLDEDAGCAVCRCCHDVMVVEAYVARVHRQLGVPVLLGIFVAQPQVPLANGCRCVADILEGIGNGELLWADNHAGIASGNVCAWVTESIFASQKSIARRRTRGSNRVNVCEAYAALSQSIDIGCLHSGCSKAFQVAIAEVVGENDNHIGLLTIAGSGIPLLCLSAGGDDWQQGRSQRAKAEEVVFFHHACKDKTIFRLYNSFWQKTFFWQERILLRAYYI